MAQAMGLDEGRRRAILHDSEDGLGEIVLGSVMLLSGVIGITLATRWGFFGGILPMAPFFGLLPALKPLKARIAFPRTGYVALPDPSKRSRAIQMLPFFAIAIATSALPFLQHRANAFPFGLSLLFTGIFIVGAFQYRMWHLFFPAGAALGTAVWIWTFGLGGEGTIWLVFAPVGTALLLSGALRLVLFLRRYPKPA